MAEESPLFVAVRLSVVEFAALIIETPETDRFAVATDETHALSDALIVTFAPTVAPPVAFICALLTATAFADALIVYEGYLCIYLCYYRLQVY